MSELIRVSTLRECPPGKIQRVRVNHHDILLANVDGIVYAVANLCSHEDVPLHLGCLHDKTIKCSLHGSRFDLATGEPQEEPATECLQTYPVKIEGEFILIAL